MENSYHIGVNDETILDQSFDTPEDAMAFATRLLLEGPGIAADLDEDEYIWKIDVEARDAEGETLSVETLWEEEL